MKTLIVIPAYNEEQTIAQVVHGAVKHADVCVVDDASKDKTPEIVKGLMRAYPNRLFTIRHEKNTHIPGGVQDGMKFAVEHGYDYVITMDAGMSHDPAELPKFINYPPNDLVIGRRAKVEGVPIFRRIISFGAARLINYCLAKSIFNLLGPNLRDCTSGYRRYSKTAFTRIANSQLESVAFDFHMEALYLTYSNGGTVREIPITYIFSNSSFNKKVLELAWAYAKKLLKRKFGIKE